MALPRQRVDLPVHQRIGDLPDRRRGKGCDGDGHDRRQQPAADLVAIEPDDGIHAPDLQQRHEADKGDDGGDDPSQERQIAVGAGLKARKTLPQIRADAETTVDQAQRDDGREPRDQRDRDRADEILQ